jgi:hypothetical protein
MYLRTTARANKDGSVVRYLALAHNQRVGTATKAHVLLNLGREDRLDPDGLRRRSVRSTATSANPTPSILRSACAF